MINIGKLIKLLKNELFITWEEEETEERLQRIINNAIPTIILSKPKEKTTTKITTFYPKKYTKNTNSLF